MTGSRFSHVLSGAVGGLIAAVLFALLIAFDVIDTGGESDSGRTSARQTPITRPAAAREAERSGNKQGSTVSEIYERSSPGVVFIVARGGGQGESPFGLPQPRQEAATGSGFVLDRQGFILTNAHVVEDAKDVEVRFGENQQIEAKVVGADLSSDLAVLKLNRVPKDLKPLPLGNSDEIEVGDPAIAIGNPFGLDRTVTTGIVSAKQRKITAPNGFQIENVVQTDASINPGNSGGPLLDADGAVIGINSQIATGGGGNGSVGIGFAVPINTAKTVVPQLKEDGKVDRAYLGVTTAPVTAQVADDLNLPAKQGALVQAVVDSGPADKAGLRAGRTQTADGLVAGGDLIVKVDGRDIKAPEDVAAAIADNKPGDSVKVEYFRGDDRKTTTIRLGNRPANLEANPRAEGGPERGPERGEPFPLP